MNSPFMVAGIRIHGECRKHQLRFGRDRQDTSRLERDEDRQRCATDTKVASGVWHTLRVAFTENKFIVTFDRRKVIEATDNSFPDAGKVGVWTKADSMTLFDDFSYGAK